MDKEDPRAAKSPRQQSVVSIVLSVVGIVLPLGIVIGCYPFVKHGRTATYEEITLVLLSSFLFLLLELVALVFGIAARRHSAWEGNGRHFRHSSGRVKPAICFRSYYPP